MCTHPQWRITGWGYDVKWNLLGPNPYLNGLGSEPWGLPFQKDQSWRPSTQSHSSVTDLGHSASRGEQ